MSLARLLISCPDRPGIVAAVGRFLCDRGANIVASAQHTTDPADGTFFMRVEFVVNGEECLRPSLEAAFQRTVAASFRMRWRMAYATDRKRLGILVSKHDHCLLDIVWRWRRGELDADIVGVASNHPDLEEDVENFGLAYKHIPMDPSRRHAEQSIFELFDGNVDFLVLARYMQILTGEFLLRINVPVINIHHAFLPSFAGGNPYGQALERGVKIIGATATTSLRNSTPVRSSSRTWSGSHTPMI